MDLIVPEENKKPLNYRILHVSIPESIFNHAKAQAYLSGIPWTRFIQKLLAECSAENDTD